MNSPTTLIGNLMRMQIIAGAVLIGALLITSRTSPALSVAAIALAIGFSAFMIASQFLISIEMEDTKEDETQKARRATLAIPFFIGWVSYLVAGIAIILYFV